MANEELSDKIEAWLQGKLSAAEAAAFEAEMDANPDLAEQVKLHRLTFQAMDHLSEQRLQQNALQWMGPLNDADDSENAPQPASPYRNWFWASIALLLLAGAFVFYQLWKPNDTGGQKIAALETTIRQQDSLLFELKQYGAPNAAAIDSLSRLNAQLRQQLQEAAESIVKPLAQRPMAYYKQPAFQDNRRGADPVDQRIKQGIAFFKKSDFKQAEISAREALKLESDNRDALHLLAHALFGQHRFIEAEVAFSALIKEYSSSSDGARDAEWNKLLCHRALAPVDAAQQELYRIALDKILKDGDNPFHAAAIQMDAADKKNSH